MTVTEFLEARIAEDEALARLAADGADGKWSRAQWPDGVTNPDECRVEGAGIIIYDEGGHDANQAEHIATWDPARVLAECAAKRAILAGHQESERNRWMPQENGFCETCADWDNAEQGYGPPRVDYPCATVKTVAAVYADHPDYKKDWAL